MTRLTLLYCCCMFCFAVHAQFLKKDSANYIKFFSGGNINKTTGSSTYSLNNNLIYTYTKNRFNLNSAAAWLYTTQQKSIINNDFNSFLNLDFNKNPDSNVHSIYYWGLFTFDKSYSLKINYRYQSGAGIGYSILKKPNANFSVTDGLLFETSDVLNDSLQHDKKHTVRNSLRIKYHFFIKNKLAIDGIHFIQPSLKEFDNYNLQSTNNITYKINSWLGLGVTLVYNKITFNDRENLQITYGLTAEKKF